MPRGGVPRMARRLTKPASIRSDPWRSRKWNEIVRGRDPSPSDAPTIELLVSWYQVIEQCMDDIGANGGVQVAYQNDMGDIRALPKLSTSLLTSQIGTAPKHMCGASEPSRNAIFSSMRVGDEEKDAVAVILDRFVGDGSLGSYSIVTV